MRTQFEKGKATFIQKQDGTKVFYAFVDKIDYRFSDLPRWAQALPDSALLVINPEMKDGKVVMPDNIWTKKQIYSNLYWDSFYEMGRED